MRNVRNLALWILIALLVVLLFNLFQGTGEPPSAPAISYSQFREEVLRDEVKQITIQGDVVRGVQGNGDDFTTVVPSNDPSLWQNLKEHNVTVTIMPPDDGMPTLLSVLLNWFPMLLLVGVWVYFLRKARIGEVQATPQSVALNWRRGLKRSWVVGSLLWLAIWASIIWNSCAGLSAAGPDESVCWLGPIHLPGLAPALYAPLGSFTVWNWTVLVAEGLAVPAAAFVLGAALVWAAEGFRKQD